MFERFAIKTLGNNAKICFCSAPSISKIIIARAIFDFYLISYVAANANACGIVCCLFGSDQGFCSQDIWNLARRTTVLGEGYNKWVMNLIITHLSGT